MHTNSYKAGYVPPHSASFESPPLATPSAPTGSYGSLGARSNLSGGPQESKKRSYNEIQENVGRGDTHYARGDRQMKHLRRGGRGGRGDGFSNRGGRGDSQGVGYAFPHANSPSLPPGFPNLPDVPLPQGLPFDPNDPVATMMAMQAMGLPTLPGMPSLPQAGSPNNYPEFGGARVDARERCRDYDTQGYCARGDSCPYEHGYDRLVAPNQDGRHELTKRRTAQLTHSRI